MHIILLCVYVHVSDNLQSTLLPSRSSGLLRCEPGRHSEQRIIFQCRQLVEFLVWLRTVAEGFGQGSYHCTKWQRFVAASGCCWPGAASWFVVHQPLLAGWSFSPGLSLNSGSSPCSLICATTPLFQTVDQNKIHTRTSLKKYTERKLFSLNFGYS